VGLWKFFPPNESRPGKGIEPYREKCQRRELQRRRAPLQELQFQPLCRFQKLPFKYVSVPKELLMSEFEDLTLELQQIKTKTFASLWRGDS
jgi:hypothetical protein